MTAAKTKIYLETTIPNVATHIAAATLAGVPTIVTWNFKHLANVKTMDAVNGINIPRGYPQVRIVTPDLLIGHLLPEDFDF